MFGLPGLLAVFGFVVVFGLVAGAVLLLTVGVVVVPVAGVPVVALGAAAEPVPLVLPLPEAGVPGVEAGRVVIGVGKGGSGVERTLAIISFKPASDWLWRYLYQVVRPSIQSFFPA